MSVLQVRPAKTKSRAGTKIGVVTYLEDPDLQKLDWLVSKANSNRSDVIRQALRALHTAVRTESKVAKPTKSRQIDDARP